MKNERNYLLSLMDDFTFGFPFRVRENLRAGLPISNNDNFWSISTLERLVPTSFKSDIQEKEDSFIVETELAGFNKENIEISFKNDILQIVATRDNKKEGSKKSYVVQERNYENCKRSYQFEDVNEDAITASFENGVLRVILPKKKQTPIEKGKTISIN